VQLAEEAAGIKDENKIALELKVKGVVQGVGFRPFLFNLAQKWGVKGWVRNESWGVLLEIEGEEEKVETYCREMGLKHPPLAKIEEVEKKKITLRNFREFKIMQSREQEKKLALIPPDIAACPECLREVKDPADRHYLYPFTNCTYCGPRFTIVSDIPYDRAKTSMRYFKPCQSCAEEYGDPADRRFHAQPVACPLCGPRVQVRDREGKILAGEESWREFFWEKMLKGCIFALKGLGGFHLACLVEEEVVQELRKRKKRPFKPFAVMCRDLEAVKKYCILGQEEAEVLSSPAAPILLLAKREEAVPASVSPGLKTLGVMLPYTPFHYLLMEGPFDIMVLTSANPTDLPILKDNEEALRDLREIADYFILHNRGIVQRCDDSVLRLTGEGLQFHRRSRGYVPAPLHLGFRAETVVLGAGSEMKNTFCLLRGNQAFLSQHLGEMGTVESEKFYRESLGHFLRFFNLVPQVLAYDPHPQYYLSALARSLPVEIKYAVQHHHGHFASCLVENQHHKEAVGIILDGTGYGSDGAVWGLEILSGGLLSFRREYHQRYLPLPGGEHAIRWPWRMALSYLYQSMGEKGLELAFSLFGRHFSKEFDLLAKGLKSSLFTLPVSSCGRLFDAVAAILGVCWENTYEGQAAIQLGEMLDEEDLRYPSEPYPFYLQEGEIDFAPLICALWEEKASGKELRKIVKRFHDTVAEAVVRAAAQAAEKRRLDAVALSGGTWHNPYLLRRVSEMLKGKGLKVLLHLRVPPNDGGLSLGQAAVAYWRWKENVPGDTDENS